MTHATLSISTPPRNSNPQAALTFITCGSVDDGKSTLIGRLLLDSQSLLQDQMDGAKRLQGSQAIDLAAFTDGLSSEREQGITIDVAWRYFATAQRKFIIGDTPGHEQYTRNMVTAATQADAAVVLIDALKVEGQTDQIDLLPQTRRHTLLAQLLRVPHLIFAVNKLDAVVHAESVYARITAALEHFMQALGLPPPTVVPMSALLGYNVVRRQAGWLGYQGPSLLEILEHTPHTGAAPESSTPANARDAVLSVQWVQKDHASADTSKSRRTLWGTVLSGQLAPGDEVYINGATRATISDIRTLAGDAQLAHSGSSVGVRLDREVDASRGDWIAVGSQPESTREALATVAWLDTEPLTPGRTYWALHGHRWTKAKVKRIVHELDVQDLAQRAASQLLANAIGQVELLFQTALPLRPYAESPALGRLILVDTATHATVAALLVEASMTSP